jgi:HEPN domain-containing protein
MATKRASQNQPPEDSAKGLIQLGEQFWMASRFIHEGFKSTPKWPTYQAAFQALENFLKAYLMLKGATRNEFGHNVRESLQEANAKGLVLKADPKVEETVMTISDYYTDSQRYSPTGEWAQVPPHLVITFVDQVRRDARL